jgi:hypothetical protein
MSNPEVIDQYHERIKGLIERRFSLLKDSVKIVGTVRGNPCEGVVMLSGLQAAPFKTWMRTKHFHWSLALLFILTPFLFLPFVVSPPNFYLLVVGMLLYLPAIWYFIRNRERKEIATFLNRSGAMGFDLWRCGPDAERFPEFVASISKQISEQIDEQGVPITRA